MNDDERRRALLRHSVGLDPIAQPADDDLADWIGLAARERVIPVLYDLATSLPDDELVGDVSVEPAQIDIMRTMVRHEHDLVRIAGDLERVHIDFAVLKGFATAHLDHDRPELRQSADVDLLVSPDDLELACETLAASGWTQAYALPRHHREFTHAVTLRNGDRVEVDLHQRIAHRSLGHRLDTGELLSRRTSYSIAGQHLWALDDVDRVIHAAVHHATSRAPHAHLSSTVDLLVMCERRADRADDVVERSSQFHTRHLVRRAIEHAYAAAAAPVPDAWASAFEPGPSITERLAVLPYTGDRRRPALEELYHLAAISGWRRRWRYVSGYFATDDDYREQHRRAGFRSQARYLVSRLRSRD